MVNRIEKKPPVICSFLDRVARKQMQGLSLRAQRNLLFLQNCRWDRGVVFTAKEELIRGSSCRINILNTISHKKRNNLFGEPLNVPLARPFDIPHRNLKCIKIEGCNRVEADIEEN